jgi:hypothetical protein
MKLSVLVLDYDGSFTRDDRPHASMLAGSSWRGSQSAVT